MERPHEKSGGVEFPDFHLMRDYRYYSAATTNNIKGLVNMLVLYRAQMIGSAEELRSAFAKITSPTEGEGVCLPITLLERLMVLSIDPSLDYKINLDFLDLKVFESYQVMAMYYQMLLQPYVEVGYAKLQDYTIYAVLKHIQEFLRSFYDDYMSFRKYIDTVYS